VKMFPKGTGTFSFTKRGSASHAGWAAAGFYVLVNSPYGTF
jgi:hypothetical protein